MSLISLVLILLIILFLTLLTPIVIIFLYLTRLPKYVPKWWERHIVAPYPDSIKSETCNEEVTDVNID